MDTPSEPAPPPADHRRLMILCVTAVTMGLLLALYLLGPRWPGQIGRLQVATWEAWGWSGPADLRIEANPAAAWIELDGPNIPGGIQGQGVLRAKLSSGVYHCRVRMKGYTTQEFEIDLAPDEVRPIAIVLVEPR